MISRQRDRLLATLQSRFGSNPPRHQGLAWSDVLSRLRASPGSLRSLAAMEASGGEPDVTGRDGPSGAIIFSDCSLESPTGRRSLCYDRAGLESRRENQPRDSAVDMARDMGVELLNEAQYRALQRFGPFDGKSSSWILTPPAMRRLGGALFGDFRYGQVFTYHNGAQSYYAARGFRGQLRV